MIYQCYSPINKQDEKRRNISHISELKPITEKVKLFIDGSKFLIEFDDGMLATNICLFNSEQSSVHIDMWESGVSSLFKLLIMANKITQADYNEHKKAYFKYLEDNTSKSDIDELKYCMRCVTSKDVKNKLKVIIEEFKK